MRVLLLNAKYCGGGAERTGRELLTALRENQIDATLLVGPKDASYPPGVCGIRLSWEKYLRIIQWVTLEVDWRHIGSIRTLGRINAGDYDLIHAHNLFGGWTSLQAVRELSQRIPMVWTFHDECPVTLTGPYDLERVMDRKAIIERWGPDQAYYSSHPKARWIEGFCSRRLPHPAAIICPSRWLANLAEQCSQYPGVPIHHVPHGLSFMHLPQTKLDRAEARQALRVPLEAKVVLIVAAHLGSPYKGMPLGLEALRKLRTQNVHLLVAGEAPPDFQASVTLPATYMGYVSSDQTMAQLYRAADVTLMPSIAENLPYVAMESFACQTPIVAFALGGFPELIGENQHGVSARPLDTGLLAEAVDRLLTEDVFRRECGQRARRWIEEHCDVSRWVQRHLEIYQQAIADFSSETRSPASSGVHA
jgi:glycosyltransferase involved in cell wall biosynthesis